MRARWYCVVTVGVWVAGGLVCGAQPQAEEPAAVQAEATEGSGGTGYSALVTIRRALLKDDGTVVRAAADVRYRWDRSRTARGWSSVITFLPSPLVESGGQATASGSPVSRIENDEDGSPLRVYDAAGRLMPLPSPDMRRILGEPAPGVLDAARDSFAIVNTRRAVAGRARAEGPSLIARAGDREARRMRLEGEFGRPVGRLGALDRYVSTTASGSVEVLADPGSAVPVEVNVTTNGRLTSHVTYSYSADATGAIYTRAIHGEQLVSPATQDRAQIDIEFAGISVGEGR